MADALERDCAMSSHCACDGYLRSLKTRLVFYWAQEVGVDIGSALSFGVVTRAHSCTEKDRDDIEYLSRYVRDGKCTSRGGLGCYYSSRE